LKILLVSNHYYDRGGDCTYLFALKKLLEEKGHKVIIFSMHHPHNFNSEYSKYFVSYINYAAEVKKNSLYSGLKVLHRSLYSLEARRKIERLLNEEDIDIVHIQSLHHHLTHSILFPIKKHKIPIVWTLHDYALVCPNTLFLCQGEVCERCKKNKYYWAIIRRCKKGSLGASMVAMIETIIHRIMNIRNLVDLFITPSEFMKNKLIGYGFDNDKIVCVNNFIDFVFNEQSEDKDGYYLYIGRLSGEKGIKTLIDAAVKSGSGKLKIVGDGELKDEIVSYVKAKGGDDIIEFLGHKDHDTVMDLLSKCLFMVMPSECYENFPYAVLEAFSCGKPVVGSRIGGIPELVKDNETGVTFEAGNSEDLSTKIKYLLSHPDELKRMGKNSRSFIKQHMSKEKHYSKLMEIYEHVIKNSNS
jgi:glycosyltransferase involved in cell wall biosynthesis